MTILSNEKFRIEFGERGTVQSLVMKDDPHEMNWVVDPHYLREVGFQDDEDKLFGEWSLQLNDRFVQSSMFKPNITKHSTNHLTVEFKDVQVKILFSYLLEGDQFRWGIKLTNESDETINIQGLHVWFSLAYIMFRTQDVYRNMHESCAVYTHIGGNFAKFAAVRRSNEGPHLGIYTLRGNTSTLGSLCRYCNRFLEQVSPSLDGLLYHRLSLVEDGTSLKDLVLNDWIYDDAYKSLTLMPGQAENWEYGFVSFQNLADFYHQGKVLGHPHWSYTPVVPEGGQFTASVRLPRDLEIRTLMLHSAPGHTNDIEEKDISTLLIPSGKSMSLDVGSDQISNLVVEQEFIVTLPADVPGERKLELILKDGRRDMLVWNVLEPVHTLLEKRAEWLAVNSYEGGEAAVRPHAFRPLSNQGESLGKLAFLLMENLKSSPVPEQVMRAEAAAVLDMKVHWFIEGDLSRPQPLYGNFYRIYDFDYIAHVFYLLSQMDEELLHLHSPSEYLKWAAEIICLRLDPDCHLGQREKDESRLNGVFILYIRELLQALKDKGYAELHNQLRQLWDRFGREMEIGVRHYGGAVTEHFYDNAGFGPTCTALCFLGHTDEASQYGQLILANIGFSNDYRLQNPDRWWEALSPMIHSLWGGLAASSALVAYEHLGNTEYLEAAYRSTMAIFHCYDWNVKSTPRRLEQGEAASTYSVSAPNLNMPELSRNRFGQSVFVGADDPLFAALFSDVSGDDWDMGEELVAYLLGFGTTTYLYRDEGGTLRCVNGFVTEEHDGWTVKSYAAYPSRYVFREEDLEFRAPQGTLQKSIRLENGKFCACL
ncbi:hypothetical protein ACFTRD_13010 [Paenibacillus sp. NPDC056933]|uniref:hypothetical protein n=1 Tax=Paenibacillus sp. NPDC056933 TaxID=3345968 RepID=UPI00362823A5